MAPPPLPLLPPLSAAAVRHPLPRTYSCSLEKDARYSVSGDAPLAVAVDEHWRGRAHVCACADREQDHEEQRLEVEQRRLRQRRRTMEGWLIHVTNHGSRDAA